MKIESIPINLIKPYAKNQKIHTEEQIQQVANSIKNFGFIQPLVIDKDNNLIIGHCRLESAKSIGMKELPCVMTENLTDHQIKLLRIADNRLNESKWDDKLLNQELKELQGVDIDINFQDIGFTEAELQELDLEKTIPNEDDVIEPDDIQEPTVKKGEIWLLGHHRLMCGDSTKENDVNKLMDGSIADMVMTDPPYNINISNSNGKTIQNDNLTKSVFIGMLKKAFYQVNKHLKRRRVLYMARRKHILGIFRRIKQYRFRGKTKINME